MVLEAVGNAQEYLAVAGQYGAGRQLALGEGDGKAFADAHHFAGGLHFRAQHDVDAGKLDEGENGFLDGDVAGDRLAEIALVGQRHADHYLGGHLGERHARGLGDERHGAARPGVHLEHVHVRPAVFAFDGVLDVHQASDFQAAGEAVRGLADFRHDRAGQAVRRDGAGRVAGVDAGLLDVLHHAGDDHLVAVGDGVDVDFRGFFQEAVDQHRLSLGDQEGGGHETLELGGVVADLHRPAAEHETGPHQAGVAHLGHFGGGPATWCGRCRWPAVSGRDG